MTRRLCTLAVAAFIAAAAAGCSSGTPTPAAATSTTAVSADGSSYASLDALLAALKTAGIPCSGPSRSVAGTVSGESDNLDCTSPGAPAGTDDTVLVLFDTAADATGWASTLASNGDLQQGGEIVTGQDWGVNTTATYAAQIIAKLGGTGSMPQPSNAAS